MAKRILLVLLIISLIFSASACASIYQAEYSYSAPYSEETETDGADTGKDVRHYSQLENVLNDMVSRAITSQDINFSGYNGSVSEDLAAACYELKTKNPMGAYAVEEVNYELRRIVSYYTATVTVSYKRTQQEIDSVVTVNGVSALRDYIFQSVSEQKPELTVKVYSTTVNEKYISDLVHRAYLSDPMMYAVEPSVVVAGYPADGINRVYEINVDYKLTDAEIARIKGELAEAVQSAAGSISESSTGDMALDCAEYLSSRCLRAALGDGEADTAYSALVGGRASSMGMAMAYKALCDALGIDCQVVQGSLGTLGAETHYWNIIAIDSDYYHVDVYRMQELGADKAFLMSDEDAWGDYMWDSKDYPSCEGTLTYADISHKARYGDDEQIENDENMPSDTLEPEVTASPEDVLGTEIDNNENIS